MLWIRHTTIGVAFPCHRVCVLLLFKTILDRLSIIEYVKSYSPHYFLLICWLVLHRYDIHLVQAVLESFNQVSFLLPIVNGPWVFSWKDRRKTGWVICHICVWKKKVIEWVWKPCPLFILLSQGCLFAHHQAFWLFYVTRKQVGPFICNASMPTSLFTSSPNVWFLAVLLTIASNSASCGCHRNVLFCYRLLIHSSSWENSCFCAILGESSAVGGRENGSWWRLPLKWICHGRWTQLARRGKRWQSENRRKSQ